MLQALVSGFGPFLGVTHNPSRTIAARLAARPPLGWNVTALELPVSFGRVASALEEALDRLDGPPDLLLGLGVHRGPFLRLERRAARRARSLRPDNDGHVAATEPGQPGGPGGSTAQLETSLAVEPLLLALGRTAAAWPRLSSDAGGYVCEATYYELLARVGGRARSALFLHVAPERHLPVSLQTRAVTDLLLAARDQLER